MAEKAKVQELPEPAKDQKLLKPAKKPFWDFFDSHDRGRVLGKRIITESGRDAYLTDEGINLTIAILLQVFGDTVVILNSFVTLHQPIN